MISKQIDWGECPCGKLSRFRNPDEKLFSSKRTAQLGKIAPTLFRGENSLCLRLSFYKLINFSAISAYVSFWSKPSFPLNLWPFPEPLCTISLFSLLSAKHLPGRKFFALTFVCLGFGKKKTGAKNFKYKKAAEILLNWFIDLLIWALSAHR